MVIQSMQTSSHHISPVEPLIGRSVRCYATTAERGKGESAAHQRPEN